MTIPWGQICLLVGEALVVAWLLLYLFRQRERIGLAPLYLAVGTLQPLQVFLASALYLEIWGGITVSPGSSVLFPATLLAVLLVYIREDATEARNLIFGILAANIVASVLFLVAGFQTRSAAAAGAFDLPAALFEQNVRVMLVGTLVLFLDALLVIVVFERTSRFLSKSLFVHILVTLSVVLAFDTVAFSVGAFLGEVPMSGFLVSGLAGKTFFALFYSSTLTFYLTRLSPLEPDRVGETAELAIARHARDPFARFSYRQRYEAAKEQSVRDPLTGLHNRGFFNEILPLMLERSRRSGSEVTLLMIDLENFKEINDTYGHLAGDDALREFADILRASARAEDVVCRYGGDEFAVVVRHVSEGDAGAALVNRLEVALRRRATEDRDRLSSALGMTVGEATYPSDGETSEELLQVADERLYAKRGVERSE